MSVTRYGGWHAPSPQRGAEQLPGGAGERQPRLRVARDDLRGDAEHLDDPVGELLGVGGVPGGAGRHHPDRLRRGRADEVGVLAQRGHRPVQGRLGQPAGAVHAFPEPDDPHLAGHVGEGSGPVTGTNGPFDTAFGL